ncbi:Apc13p-domain-containing protein [Cucurbitaria berberidis CBS 394.84]|uniref:Apc13p-domain-containing protein n=1 Tax=Cucurbitaria berberidis CBS 394.84 TaxID=1168544 RepID=A0A9P4LA57_9PLEO|nr:Apc13p-domain-containing protein [Cucurbitaria berberidis CBS 394.84]KAF1847012.1 Apc13p-domain-containing protein [Cucurbitaria berberidis CBS 394.84]
MTRDSTATYLHMHQSHHADLLEQFTNLTSSQLAPEDIYIPPHLQPVNPEDEDDVVPDQHAAFGIQRATQTKKEPTWRDLGLDELLRRGPREALAQSGSGGTSSGAGVSAGGVAQGRHDEPVRLALRRQPGARGAGVRPAQGGSEMHAGGGGPGNGLPR